jgi:hypothetical protein
VLKSVDDHRVRERRVGREPRGQFEVARGNKNVGQRDAGFLKVKYYLLGGVNADVTMVAPALQRSPASYCPEASKRNTNCWKFSTRICGSAWTDRAGQV